MAPTTKRIVYAVEVDQGGEHWLPILETESFEHAQAIAGVTRAGGARVRLTEETLRSASSPQWSRRRHMNTDAQERMIEDADEAHGLLDGLLIRLSKAAVFSENDLKLIRDELGKVADHIEAILVEAGASRAIDGDGFP
jgi:hypothetical protein